MTELPDGTPHRVDSAIPREECELLYRSVDLAEAESAVEIGMANGVSTLAIADALHRRTPAATLTSIDPHQTSGWRGAGLHLLERAGLASVVTLVEQTSQSALPELAARGYRCRLVFIDGWHTFDHTLVDFFYGDLLLEQGGVVVFDDVGYPAIRSVVSFVLANRDYDLVDGIVLHPPSVGLRVRRRLKRLLRPLARTDRDPCPAHERVYRSIENCVAVALRKRGDDRRRYDDFERF